MTIGVAGGHPQYGSEGTSKFIPTLWATKALVKFYSACVLASISNTDVDGSGIKEMGDKVEIRTRPDITVSRYYKGQTLAIQRPESANVSFTVDYAYYFNFICDAIDEYQSDMRLMNLFGEDAGYQMKIAIDTLVLADIYNDADTYNAGNSAGLKSRDIALGVTSTAPLTVTKANIIDVIVDVDTVLNEQNVPQEDRWFIIPPWMRGMILKSDLKDASMTGDGQSVLRNGRIGRIGGFEFYISNLLYSASSEFFLVAGQKRALAFVSQMTKMGKIESESTFGTLVRGLNVFGYKVLKDEALVNLVVKKG